jgi:uncharacterized protein YlzI (FlbEa/FlbD family)
MADYKEKLYEEIAKVVSLVCKNPSIFVSETDIHALMMTALMSISHLNPFKEGNLKYTGVRRGGAKEVYETMLIHKEYGHNIKSWARSDIVIFDEEQIKNIDDPINLKNGKKYLKPKYIFEFGTDKSGGVNGYMKHLYGDFIKLFECQDEGDGFLIHIHRFEIKNNDKVEEINKKIKEYGKKTSKIWDAVKGRKEPEMEGNKVTWDSEKSEGYPNWEDTDKNKPEFRFKVLVFFVKIGGPSTGQGGKVKMFNPGHKNDSDVLIGVSQENMEKIISDFLDEDKPDLAEIIKNVNKQKKAEKQK